MKILYIVPYVPNHIYVRPYSLITGLVKQGHEVSLATLWSNDSDRDAIAALEASGVDVYARAQPVTRSLLNAVSVLPSSTPLQAVYSWQPGLAQAIERLLAKNNGNPLYDVVHVEHLRGSRYAQFVKSLRTQPQYAHLKSTPIIWDSVDSIAHLFRQASQDSRKWTSRVITRFELPRTEQYERQLASAFDHVLVTSPKDKEIFLQHTQADPSAPPITVLPNGVDLAYFHPAQDVQRDASTLVVSGKMSYHANMTMVLYLVNEIMPLVWETVPQARLQIVGKDPGKEISNLSKHPQIEVTGTVPDIRPYLQQATLAVAPIQYGAGIQNKVLEAMACATPVVCASQAVSALQAEVGQDLLVADTPQAFAQSILQLLSDCKLQAKIGWAGRRYVEAHHDWTTITERLETVYRQAIEARTEQVKN